jgi:hypothetical protein
MLVVAVAVESLTNPPTHRFTDSLILRRTALRLTALRLSPAHAAATAFSSCRFSADP